jgi:hypothetical protein
MKRTYQTMTLLLGKPAARPIARRTALGSARGE